MVFAVFVHLIACLAVVLLPIAVDDSDASSPSQANAESNAGITCAWDCNIIDPKFGLEMKVLISEFKIVTVQLKYEQQEEKQCSHLTEGFFTCRILEQGLERSLQPQAPHYRPRTISGPPIPRPPISNPPFQASYHIRPPTSGPHSHIKPPILGPPF